MKYFIEGKNRRILKVMKEGPFLPTHDVNGVIVKNPEKDESEEDKENVKHGLKAKNIITTAPSLDEFLRVSRCETDKEMWDMLQITHDGTTEVNREILGILTHEYEFFIMNHAICEPKDLATMDAHTFYLAN